MNGRDENMTVPFILSDVGPLTTLGWFEQCPNPGNETAWGQHFGFLSQVRHRGIRITRGGSENRGREF